MFRLHRRKQIAWEHKLVTIPMAISLYHEMLRQDGRVKRGSRFYLQRLLRYIVVTPEGMKLVAGSGVYSLHLKTFAFLRATYTTGLPSMIKTHCICGCCKGFQEVIKEHIFPLRYTMYMWGNSLFSFPIAFHMSSSTFTHTLIGSVSTLTHLYRNQSLNKALFMVTLLFVNFFLSWVDRLRI